MEQPKVDIKIQDHRLGTDWPLPQYETDGAAAIDLRACVDPDEYVFNKVDLMPGEAELISAGFSIAIEPGWVGAIIPRSGKGHKEGLVVGNLTGLIDSDYRNVVYISAWNRGEIPIRINAGDRIAQMMFVPAPPAQINFVNSLDETDRTGGFGSTGDQ